MGGQQVLSGPNWPVVHTDAQPRKATASAGLCLVDQSPRTLHAGLFGKESHLGHPLFRRAKPLAQDLKQLLVVMLT